LLDVGGIKVNVLLDTGCMTDAVSPDFARVAGHKPLEFTQVGWRPAGWLETLTEGTRKKRNKAIFWN
jgi:hypothetical protein